MTITRHLRLTFSWRTASVQRTRTFATPKAIDVMKLRPPIIALTMLLVVAIMGRCVHFGIYGHSGTAINQQALLQVYEAADPDLAEFSTNSFLQKLQFTAPIQWHRAVWRPSVSVTGRVNVVKFQSDMGDEPFQYLHPDHFSKAGGTVYYFEILHRMKDDSVVVTMGTLDLASGVFGMWSAPSERKTDDPSWHQLTNATRIEFTFSTPKK
jgi:hypothetical protein